MPVLVEHGLDEAVAVGHVGDVAGVGVGLAALGVDDGVRSAGQSAYKAVSGTTTKGFELQLSGQLTPGWQMLAGFTYAQPRDKDHNRINTNLPERQFKLSTAYTLDGALRDLTVGGNVVWQSSTYSAITYPMDARADEGSFAQ